jgi:hypothetical protein
MPRALGAGDDPCGRPLQRVDKVLPKANTSLNGVGVPTAALTTGARPPCAAIKIVAGNEGSAAGFWMSRAVPARNASPVTCAVRSGPPPALVRTRRPDSAATLRSARRRRSGGWGSGQPEAADTGIRRRALLCVTSGALVYATGGIAPDGRTLLIWVDRNGSSEPLPVPAAMYYGPELDPTEKRVAVFTRRRAPRGCGRSIGQLAHRRLSRPLPSGHITASGRQMGERLRSRRWRRGESSGERRRNRKRRTADAERLPDGVEYVDPGR